MPTIKTGTWLKATMQSKGLTQKDMAKKTGLSIPAIAKIISGERYGSASTWEKLYAVLEETQAMSIESSSFIAELKEEIELYGENANANVFYIVDNGSIIFKDYLLPIDMKEQYSDALKKMNMLSVTLKEAFELFTMQNKLI